MSDKQNKPIKKVTEGYLERAALHYLGRFSTTEANLRHVLERKVRRRNLENTPASNQQLEWIGAVAAKCVRLGYVNDKQYAKQRFESMLRKGKPLSTIAQDLRYKGVPADIISSIMEQAGAGKENMNLSAAAAYARRRRFGPFRRLDKMTEDKIKKEKASMLRAGFSFSVVNQILFSTEDELMALMP